MPELAQHSLTASFISWGHRTSIENILASSNDYTRKDLAALILLTGKLAAGTALSNATKFLSKIEELNVTIIEQEGQYYLKGRLPWVTNLRSDNFVTIFAASLKTKIKTTLILTVPSTAAHLSRSDDLNLFLCRVLNLAAHI